MPTSAFSFEEWLPNSYLLPLTNDDIQYVFMAVAVQSQWQNFGWYLCSLVFVVLFLDRMSRGFPVEVLIFVQILNKSTNDSMFSS